MSENKDQLDPSIAHLQLFAKAKKAVDDLYHDSSVSSTEQMKSLKALLYYVEDTVLALESAIKMAGSQKIGQA